MYEVRAHLHASRGRGMSDPVYLIDLLFRCFTAIIAGWQIGGWIREFLRGSRQEATEEEQV